MVAFALKRCYITVAGDLGPTRKYEQLKGWITTAGGKLSKTITIDTTHLVCTEKQWKAQIELVRKALEIKDQQPIKIVHEDWLEHSLMQTTKKKEGVYLWEKIDKASMTAKKQAEKLAKRAENETKEKRPPGGILGEALKQHTDDLLGVKEREKIERQRKKDKEREIYAREEERQAKRKLSKEAHAAIYKKGAKKARNEIFSENHHVYADSTGFKYDITLTKVNTRVNKNERHILTIYESNGEGPHTYALNVQFAGTGKPPKNDVMAAIGCNYPTAFRCFKKVFKEKTGVEWDDRVAFAVARSRQKAVARAATADGSVKGVPVVEREVMSQEEEERHFAKMPFSYHPPMYGSRGSLPARDKSQEIGPPPGEDDVMPNDIELWINAAYAAESQNTVPLMTGANGVVPDTETELPVDINSGTSALPMSLDEKMPWDDDFDTVFPFNSDSSYLQTEPTEPTLGSVMNSFGAETQDMHGPSFAATTETLGHTQIAEDAQKELEDFLRGRSTGNVPDAPDPRDAEDPYVMVKKPSTMDDSIILGNAGFVVVSQQEQEAAKQGLADHNAGLVQ